MPSTNSAWHVHELLAQAFARTLEQPNNEDYVQPAKGDRKLKFIRRQFPITTRTQCVCVWCQILGKMFIKFVASKFACRRAKTTEWSTPGHQDGLQGHDT